VSLSDNLCCKHDYSSNLEGQCRVEQTTGDVNASLGTLGNVQSKGVDFTGVNPLEIQLAILTSNIVLERVRAVDPEKSL